MATRKRPAAAQAKAAPPAWTESVQRAMTEGVVVAAAALSQTSTVGNKFWLSCGNILDLSRDPTVGDVLLRVGAEVSMPCGLELATLAGMLFAAAMIQCAAEINEENNEHE